MSRVERWDELDGLRGVAVLLVVVSHAHVLQAPAGGMVGVTLFFVLSGFLITNLLMKEVESHGRIHLGAFYGKRALRLFPALAVYLIGISVILILRTDNVPVVESIWPPALYLANYMQILGTDIYAHRHTWSLAVEEHFYLIWPLLVGLGVALRAKWLLMVVVVLAGWRVVSSFIDLEWTYMGTDTNAYALVLGAWLASIHRSRGLPRPPRMTTTLGLFGLVLLSLMPATTLDDLYELGVWVPMVAAFLSAAVICAVVAERDTTVLQSKTLRWFGMVSYALYLWHAPLLMVPGLGDTRLSRMAAVGLGIVMAWLSWRLLEGPIMRSELRRRLTERRNPVPPLGAVAVRE